LVWLVVEVLFIGGAGGFVGGLAGGAARRLLCGLAQIHQMPELVSARLIVEGTIAGLALAIIPGIAVAWSTSSVRPADVFRRMAQPVSPVAWRMAFIATWVALGLLSGVAAGVARMAAVLAWAVGSLLFSLYFCARGLFAFLAMWTPIRLGAAFRQGLRNLCRPGSSSPVTLAILALIAALAVGAAAGEQIVGQEILANSPWPHANVYILGFDDSDLDGFLTILNRHGGIERPYRVATLAWLRIGDGPRMIFTCSASQPAGSGVILDTSLARRLGVVVGSILDFEQEDRKIRAAVSQIHDLSPAERVWFSASFPCASFAGLKIFHHAGLRVREDEMAGLMRDLRRGYPSVDIDTPENMLEMVHDLATNAVALVRFIAFAAAAGGAVVAMALIGASAARRAREIAILQMLGARPAYVVAMLGWEFAGLGALAGLLGGGFGIALINGVLGVIFYKVLINPHVAIMAVSAVCGAGTGLLAGFIVCSRLVFQKPLVTLRSE
jgi:predicted lysophospholipase L1 biosynthesis ABC-type transport system permease subunit